MKATKRLKHSNQKKRSKRHLKPVPLKKFYADPTKDPSFTKIQALFYRKLYKSGFRDIEDHRIGGFEITAHGRQVDAVHGGRPLKKWSSTDIDFREHGYGNDRIKKSPGFREVIQQPLEPLRTNFPEPIYLKEERFARHPDFIEICKGLTTHKNSKLTANDLFDVWNFYVDGWSFRRIARHFNMYHTNVSHLISKLTEWMKFLGEEMDEERVVIRTYQESDAAFVFSTWRNSIWFDKKERLEAAAPSFFREMTKKIKRKIKEPMASLRIACLSIDRDHIIGCAFKIGPILEWVYVKKDYRNQGVGTLLAGEFKEISRPVTQIGIAVAAKKGFKIKGETNVEEKTGGNSGSTDRTRTDAEAA
jgi:hypothetical protein